MDDPPIGGEEAYTLAMAAVPPASWTWETHPESGDPDAMLTWSIAVTGELQLWLKTQQEGTVPTSHLCPSGLAWHLPVTVEVRFVDGWDIAIPTALQVFDDGATPEEVRFANALSAPLDLPPDALALALGQGITEAAVFEAWLNGQVSAPELAVSAIDETVGRTLWRGPSDPSVPCDPAHPHSCDTGQ